MNGRVKVALCLALLSYLLTGCSGPSDTGDAAPPSAASAKGGQAGPALALTITGYGPKRIQAGVPFNKQADGSAAAWVRVDRPMAGSHAAIEFNGTRLPSVIKGNLITARVPARLYAVPGTLKLRVAGTSREGAAVSSSEVDVIAE